MIGKWLQQVKEMWRVWHHMLIQMYTYGVRHREMHNSAKMNVGLVLSARAIQKVSGGEYWGIPSKLTSIQYARKESCNDKSSYAIFSG